MKIAYIVDSSCGITEVEAKSKGWFYLPLKLSINGKEFDDGRDMTDKEFYNNIKINDNCKTSATPPGVVLDIFENASKNFDHVIVYGLSDKLSSQTKNLTLFAKEFNNISVIKSLGVGYAITKDIEEASILKDPKEIVEKLNQMTKKQWGVAFPRQLNWLVKGGRLSPGIASMANLLKIIPIIKYEEGSLEKYGKGRVYSKAISKTMQKIKLEKPDSEFVVYHGDFDGIEEIFNMLKNILGENITFKYFPPVVASHIGPEVIAVMARQV